MWEKETEMVGMKSSEENFNVYIMLEKDQFSSILPFGSLSTT